MIAVHEGFFFFFPCRYISVCSFVQDVGCDVQHVWRWSWQSSLTERKKNGHDRMDNLNKKKTSHCPTALRLILQLATSSPRKKSLVADAKSNGCSRVERKGWPIIWKHNEASLMFRSRVDFLSRYILSPSAAGHKQQPLIPCHFPRCDWFFLTWASNTLSTFEGHTNTCCVCRIQYPQPPHHTHFPSPTPPLRIRRSTKT